MKTQGFLAGEYQRLFKKTWSPITGGVLIALLNIVMYLYARPWGVFNGAQNWGQNLLSSVGLWEGKVIPVMKFSTALTNVGLLLGAFVGALMSGKWGIHLVKPRDYFLAAIGGTLMGIGGTMARGCNVGGFFTSFAAFSMAGPLMMIGLIIGAYAGSHVYLLDLEKHPRPPAGVAVKSYLFSEGFRKIQPWIGAVLASGLLFYCITSDDGFSYRGVEGKSGILLLIALLIGFTLQRAHFCFARAFREPFMTGDGKMTQGAAVSMIIAILGFALIKSTDLADVRPANFFVNPSVWTGSLFGGVVFGFGMILAGGCASGSIWRAGEGQVRLWVALVFFAISGAISGEVAAKPEIGKLLGSAVYVPEVMGWPLAFTFFMSIPILWYLLARYNEETDIFVIE